MDLKRQLALSLPSSPTPLLSPSQCTDLFVLVVLLMPCFQLHPDLSTQTKKLIPLPQMWLSAEFKDGIVIKFTNGDSLPPLLGFL